MTIRAANLESDARALVEALERHLNPAAGSRRFDWLYLRNPWGPARSWLAVDSTGEVVGVCSAFPRRFYVGDGLREGWVLGDFCVAPHYRSAGPAIRLQRACIEAVDGGLENLCYDFPSAGMVALYARLGIKPGGRLVRFAKPLRVDRKLETVVGTLGARWVGAIGNTWLRLRDGRGRAGVEVSAHQGPCGVEFSVLSARVAGRDGHCVQRSAEYLNWRYLGHPSRLHEIVVARRHGELRGYAVFVNTGDDAVLVDLLADRDPMVIESLIRGVTGVLRARGVIALSAPLLASDPMVGALEGLGFRARESAPVIVYAGTRTDNALPELEASRWRLMDGDRES